MSRFKVILAAFRGNFRAMYTSKYAVVTNTVTSAGMALLEDVSCQVFESKHSKLKNKDEQGLDHTRTKGMILATVVCGPFIHYWYRFLDRRFPGKSARAIAKKCIADVSISPIYFSVFTSTLVAYKGGTRDEIACELKQKIPIMFMIDTLLWLPLQAINFKLLPPHYRVIGVKINEFLLGILMSHVLNNDYNLQRVKEEVKELCSRRKAGE